MKIYKDYPFRGFAKRLLQNAFGEFDGADQTTPGLLDTQLGLPSIQIAGKGSFNNQSA